MIVALGFAFPGPDGIVTSYSPGHRERADSVRVQVAERAVTGEPERRRRPCQPSFGDREARGRPSEHRPKRGQVRARDVVLEIRRLTRVERDDPRAGRRERRTGYVELGDRQPFVRQRALDRAGVDAEYRGSSNASSAIRPVTS